MDLDLARRLAADLQRLDAQEAINLQSWPLARAFIAAFGPALPTIYDEAHRTLDIHIALDVPADVLDEDLESVAEDAFVQVNEPEVVVDEDGNTQRVPTLARARMTVTVSRP